MKNKRIGKIKKNKHVGPTSLPNQRYLSGMLYRPLDQRKDGSGDSDVLLCSGECCFSDGYEMTDLPATHYERGYMV